MEKEELQLEVRQLRARVSEVKAQLRQLEFDNSNIGSKTLSEAADRISTSDHQTPRETLRTLDRNSHTSSIITDANTNSHSKMDPATGPEVVTDSSGDSWPDDLHLQPQLSHTDATDPLECTQECSLRFNHGEDEVDSGPTGDLPFRVTELPVTISIVEADTQSDAARLMNRSSSDGNTPFMVVSNFKSTQGIS